MYYSIIHSAKKFKSNDEIYRIMRYLTNKDKEYDVVLCGVAVSHQVCRFKSLTKTKKSTSQLMGTAICCLAEFVSSDNSRCHDFI